MFIIFCLTRFSLRWIIKKNFSKRAEPLKINKIYVKNQDLTNFRYILNKYIFSSLYCTHSKMSWYLIVSESESIIFSAYRTHCRVCFLQAACLCPLQGKPSTRAIVWYCTQGWLHLPPAATEGREVALCCCNTLF